MQQAPIHSFTFKNVLSTYGEEGAMKYTTGAFHPVFIGDVYNARYKIVRKLGCGSHATVWLADDMR
jgi:serine/threonine-protein kinase SRPK3